RTRMVQVLVFSLLVFLAVFAVLREFSTPRSRHEQEVPTTLSPGLRAQFHPQTLKNPGFEDKLDGWEIHTYGAASQVEADAEVAHEGKHSLRISAAEPSDTALGQEVLLKPGRWYRF